MRKILLVVVIALVGAYCGGWFYLADTAKVNVITQLELLKTKDKDVEWAYDKVTTNGFPLAIHVEVSGLRIQYGDKEADTSTVRADKLVISPNFNASALTFTLNGEMHYSEKTKEKSEEQRLSCKQNPQLTVGFDVSFLKQNIPTERLPGHITAVNYSDAGCVVENTATKAVISRSEQTALNVKVARNNESHQYDIDFAANAVERLQEKAGFGKIFFTGDFQVTGKLNPDKQDKQPYKALDLKIKEVKFSSDTTKLGISGKISGNEETIFPAAEIEIKIANYQNLVNVVMTSLKLEDKQQLVNELLKKASGAADRPENVNIIVMGDKDGYKFGTMPMADVMTEIAPLMQAKPVPKAATPAPQTGNATEKTENKVGAAAAH